MGKRHIPRRLSRGGKWQRAAAIAAVPGACLLLAALLVGTVIARYQRELSYDGSVKAKDFYFTSDFLDGGVHTFSSGSTEVTFTLGNHADALRFSEMDIAYTVTVTRTDGGAGDPTVSVDSATLNSGKLTGGQTSDATVTVSGLQPGGAYTVTATGKGGYQETLTATIHVLSGEAVVYKYLDTTHSEYVLLTVWAQGYTGSVTITPAAEKNLIPDNTDPRMVTVQTDAAITDTTSFDTSTSGYASHTYRFFGSGVTAADFAVTYGDSGSKTAEVKMPS